MHSKWPPAIVVLCICDTVQRVLRLIQSQIWSHGLLPPQLLAVQETMGTHVIPPALLWTGPAHPKSQPSCEDCWMFRLLFPHETSRGSAELSGGPAAALVEKNWLLPPSAQFWLFSITLLCYWSQEKTTFCSRIAFLVSFQGTGSEAQIVTSTHAEETTYKFLFFIMEVFPKTLF